VAGNHSAGRAPQGTPDGSGVRVAVVCARFNDLITGRMLDGVGNALAAMGVASDDIAIEWVPGAYELPLAAHALARRDDVDAVIALGCVIRGDTPHFDYVAGGAADGLLRTSLDTGVPVVFGVLTTENLEQAMERSEVGGADKGAEAAVTAVEMVRLLQRVTGGGPLSRN
jgi:6,7-dimethyl-8-ribityllumazine synthase